MVFYYKADDDFRQKDVKRRKLNPPYQNVYLNPDGSVDREEDKIIAAQRIFRDYYYQPGGKGYQKAMESFKEKTLAK